MENNKQLFQLLAIVNMEINFKREINLTEELYSKVSNDFKIDIKNHLINDQLDVFLTINFNQVYEGKNLLEITVITAGIFKKTGEMTQEFINDFANINAPAIIFPFVRETVANISMKAGVQPIIIQPVNFIELSKQSK
jgi:preprotein translocase subunit SecB